MKYIAALVKKSATLIGAMIAVGIPIAVASAADEPALRFLTLSPVTIEGDGFRSGERLDLVLSLNDSRRAKKSIRVSGGGTFTVTFSDVVVQDRCNSDIWALAMSAEVTRAWVKLPQPLCPPAL